MRMKRMALVVVAALLAGCPQHVMVPQLVRSYTTERPQAVGPEGKALVPTATVLVANAPYLQHQCANQVRAGGQPLHAGPSLERYGCVRIAPGDRPEIVVPDTNEQAAVAHELEHLRGRWCHDAQGNPADCPR